MKETEEGLDVTVSEDSGRLHVHLKGSLESADLDDARRAFERLPERRSKEVVVSIDEQPLKTRGIVILDHFCRLLEQRGLRVSVVAGGAMSAALAAYAKPTTEAEAPRPRDDVVDRLARWQKRFAEGTLRYLHLFRQTLVSAFGGVFRRKRFKFDDFFLALIQSGLGAVPLVVLISGLVGAILALQAGPFFERYGQENLVAQLVALSMLRDVGPLLTAILVAGRSGSSLAAEIGTMTVSEEVDALVVMGSEPIRVLVAPRFLALFCALPCLVMLSDVVGILGGMVVGGTALGIPTSIYYDQTLKGLEMKDVVGGLMKAAAYAIVITTIAGHQGFSTTGGASGVGRSTTRSVVMSILWIIVVDAFFTWMMYMMDL